MYAMLSDIVIFSFIIVRFLNLIYGVDVHVNVNIMLYVIFGTHFNSRLTALHQQLQLMSTHLNIETFNVLPWNVYDNML